MTTMHADRLRRFGMVRVLRTTARTTARTTIFDVMSSPRPFVAGLLVWASLIGGWLVLGALGSTRMPLQAGGLAPLAAWLAAAGLTRQLLRAMHLAGTALRLVIVASSLAAVVALNRAVDGGGSLALLVAAIAWGVSLAASSCALPPGTPADSRWAWREPSAWVALSARWSMLPMMASLGFMTQWCGDAWGLTASASFAWHLCAMILPAVFARRARIDARPDAWIAIAMAAGVVATFALPVLQALTVASLCQSVACSLAWSSRGPTPMVRAATAGGRGWLVACVPACCVWVFGVALADSGPLALLAVQRGLGLLAAVGIVASVCGTVSVTARVGS